MPAMKFTYFTAKNIGGDFVYIGRLKLVSYTQESQRPSRFTFETC